VKLDCARLGAAATASNEKSQHDVCPARGGKASFEDLEFRTGSSLRMRGYQAIRGCQHNVRDSQRNRDKTNNRRMTADSIPDAYSEVIRFIPC
jgi:hypothetical protein